MKKIKKWDLIHDRDFSVSDEKIAELESKMNVKFPKAYKNFLSITGRQCRPLTVCGLSHMFEYLEEIQGNAFKLMKENGLDPEMIERPFFVFAILYDVDAFYYFHFDEGDNPPVRRLACIDYAEGDRDEERVFGVIGDNFIDWVNARIDNYRPEYDN